MDRVYILCWILSMQLFTGFHIYWKLERIVYSWSNPSSNRRNRWTIHRQLEVCLLLPSLYPSLYRSVTSSLCYCMMPKASSDDIYRLIFFSHQIRGWYFFHFYENKVVRIQKGAYTSPSLCDYVWSFSTW